MDKSSCELLLHYYPSVTKVEELRSTYITNCVFNNSVLYRHHVEHCNNPRHKKNFVAAKHFEDITPESCCL